MSEKKAETVYDFLSKYIDNIAYDMRDERFDGYYHEHCRDTLKKLREHINKVLEK